ncbi:MAG: GNAT family N-acetyltransferase, partial [Chloroflexota bacterium]
WDRRGYGAWALVEKATDRFMGHVGLFIIDNTDVIEVGYALGRTFWGNGYATEAAHATLRYGFDVVGLDEIVAVAFPENTASLRVMEKVGMTSQGITDRYYDVMLACYTLTRADFEKQNAR